MGDDAWRPMITQLRRLGHVEKLDVFIYSRGGAIDVPWRLNNAFRQVADAWSVLIPFRANSAATLLSLGADEVILGPQAELGPIDPSLDFVRDTPGGQVQGKVSVEDVMAYVRFAREQVGLSEQAELSSVLAKLVDRLDAVMLGNVYRTHSHIRDVARRMLMSRQDGMTDSQATKIVETLAERVYAHGHAVGLAEAKEIGLPVVRAEPGLEDAMWRLLELYERDLKILTPIDPFFAVQKEDPSTESVTLAVVETVAGTHECSGTLQLHGRRQMPASLQAQINIPIQLPQGVDPSSLPAEVAQMLQSAQQQLMFEAQQAVQNALNAQAPIVDVGMRILGAEWREVYPEDASN